VVQPSPELKLIVTADDFGIGLATSRGIVAAHRNGPVTATSLMTVTGDHARRSVPLLADCPDLDVGLHLTLTLCGERPLMARQSSGLVDRQGDLLTLPKLWLAAVTRKLDRLGVADEIAAQTELFHKLVGRPPAYVDGHHHAHQLPVVREALLDVIGHHLLPPVTRTTIEPPGVRLWVNAARAKRAVANAMGRSATKAFGQRWTWSNDYFVGMIGRRDQRRPFPWARFLRHLPSTGVVEWCVHPGEPDDTLVGRDGYVAARAAELAALTGPAGRAAWERLRSSLARKSVLSRTAGEG
jgi:predicted glycoside hydrolase/deacetylase ChbG (UPF0249 family)